VKLSAFRPPAAPEPIKPARVVLIQPNDFADSWSGRPKSAVAVGLRRLSETEEQTAIRDAASEARDAMQDWPEAEREGRFVEAFNEALLRIGVGRAVCDPNNVAREHPALPLAEDTLGRALRRNALAGLWEALEQVVTETSPLCPEATDEELAVLAWGILAGRVAELPASDQRRARRFAAAMLIDLPEAPPDEDDLAV